MNKLRFAPLIVLAIAGNLGARQVAHQAALDDIKQFITHTITTQKLTLTPEEQENFFSRAAQEVARRQKSNGHILTDDVSFIKTQFKKHVRTLKNQKQQQAVTCYFDAVHNLKQAVFTAYDKAAGAKTTGSTRYIVWAKIKKQMVDKTLRAQAFVNNKELMVYDLDIENLKEQVTARTLELVKTLSARTDRSLPLGYAESKIRDQVRRFGYRSPATTTQLVRDALKEVKKAAGKKARIAQSKIEEITAAVIKKFKEAQQATNPTLSRLQAEIEILKAVRRANLDQAKEITLTNKMMDALTRQSSRESLTTDYVKELIDKTLAPAGSAIKKVEIKPKKKI
jgi:hypothetical protein